MSSMSQRAGFFFVANARQEAEQSLAYARSCYNTTNSALSPKDQTFVERELPQNVMYNATCPFEAPICLKDAVHIDTGFIDFNVPLGINARMRDRVL